MDYTPEGVRQMQGDIALAQVYLINKELRKLNRKISALCLAGVIFILIKHKDKIEGFINTKGE